MPLPKVPANKEDLYTFHNRAQNRYKYREMGIDYRLLQGIKAYYYAAISFVDHQIGLTLSELEKNGKLDNTLILFSSDHGEHLGDCHCFGKRSMLDTAARIPMIVRYPKEFKASTIIEKPVSLVDVAPTFLEAADITTEEKGYDGVSLQKMSSGKSDRDEVFSQYSEKGSGLYAIITETEKYIYSAADKKEFYFDLKTDPQENRNHFGLLGTAEKIKKLRNRLLKFHYDNNDLDAVELKEGELIWKDYGIKEFYKTSDEGLITQDHPWSDKAIF